MNYVELVRQNSEMLDQQEFAQERVIVEEEREEEVQEYNLQDDVNDNGNPFSQAMIDPVSDLNDQFNLVHD